MIVDIYRNLNNGQWSIRHKGKVIGYARYLLIRPIKFHVGQSQRKRAVLEGQRNVHAWIRGEIVSKNKKMKPKGHVVTYDPFDFSLNKEGYFYGPKGEVFAEDFDFIYFDADLGEAYGW
jgi:hypothetical protein